MAAAERGALLRSFGRRAPATPPVARISERRKRYELAVLRDLHIKNLAVVAEASITLGPGFNVLSGETGAGKSIVVDALALLAGVRASSDLIRTGADSLVVTGVFTPADDGWRERLRAVGLDADDEALVVRREVARSGPNRVFVNDQPVTLKLLGDLTRPLVRIHGQREELGLVAPELQRAWLDRSGGSRGRKLVAEAAAAHAEVAQLRARLERFADEGRVRIERLDLLRFQLGEIDDAALTAGEEDELRRERDALRHAEAIRESGETVVDRLYDRDGAVYESLEASRQALERITAWVPEAASWAAELEELRIRAGEVADTVRRVLEGHEHAPGRLDAVEARLAAIERLLRKHGASSADVLARRAEMAAELEALERGADDQDALRARMEAALGAFRKVATRLSSARGTWARALAKNVLAECADLALPKARFEVGLERRRRSDSPLVLDGAPVDFGPSGFDAVEYRFSPNPGEVPRPLAKAASGGELSRLYLAVQLASRDEKVTSDATLVFDEVDTGVGGSQAASLGDKLRRLAQGGQVVAVTHLPQVASYGDRHLKVAKVVRGGRTHTAVVALDEAARTEEIARMLAGSEITELSLSHARELIAETVS